MSLTDRLRVNEIFLSIDGEVNPWGQGKFSVFLRLQGCNLFLSKCCSYCDTKKSQQLDGGTLLFISDVWKKIKSFGCKKITITGGEPLNQDIELIIELGLAYDYDISIETNGTLECNRWWIGLPNISFIIDIKLPSSGINENLIRFDWIQHMSFYDNTRIKFAVSNKKDFFKACEYISLYELPINKCAFSPVFADKNMPVKELFDLIVKNGYTDAILSVQLHKLVGMR